MLLCKQYHCKPVYQLLTVMVGSYPRIKFLQVYSSYCNHAALEHTCVDFKNAT